MYRCGVKLIGLGFLIELTGISWDVSCMIHYSNYINGQFVDSSHSNTITVINPATGAAISTIPDSSPEQVEAAIAAAEAAQPAWAALPAVARGKHLHVLADKIREQV